MIAGCWVKNFAIQILELKISRIIKFGMKMLH
jgi:hypothetical protein